MTERQRLINRVKKLRDEIQQYFWDTEHWNNLHPNEPIDPDPDEKMKNMLKGLETCLRRENIKVV